MSGVVIFAIAGTLGALTLPGGELSRAQLAPHPHMVRLLRQLNEDGVALGVEIPDERFDADFVARLLREAGLLGLVDPSLIQQAPFAAAVALEGPAVFVSRDRFRRARAADGFRRVPDASLVRAALGGETFFYLRASAKQPADPKAPKHKRFSWQPIVKGIELAPVRVTVEGGYPVLYAVAGETAIGRLAEWVSVERLGEANLPERTDLVLFQTSFSVDEGAGFRARLEGLPLFLETATGALVALDATQPVGAFHPPDDSHGYTRALPASQNLIPTGQEVQAPAPSKLDEGVQNRLAELNGTMLKKNLEPWFGGGQPVGQCGVPIAGRFLYHPDNKLAVTALVCELQSILGNGATHAFTLNGLHENVFGDLAGDPQGARADEVVVVGAHLDSTAVASVACSLPADSACVAPGADDDASGIAAVLSIAKRLKQHADATSSPARTIRFALFNAEEQGMVGSDAYADDLASGGKQVVAMFQLDMIGTPGLGQPPPRFGCACPKPPWVFEIHMSGWADLGVKIWDVYSAQEVMRAALVEAATLLSPGLTARSFPVQGCTSDPGAGRSDHSSFQLRSFPACYVAEELWTEDCPGAMRLHPTYHSSNDTTVDVDYAAAIARAVAGAAWLVANP